MRMQSVTVTVTVRQRQVLEAVVRSKLAPQRLVERCRIVLMSAEGRENADQAANLGVDRQRIRRWRHRWAKAREVLAAAEKEGATDKDLEKLILSVLANDPRSGAPTTFTPEQVAGIIALACDPTLTRAGQLLRDPLKGASPTDSPVGMEELSDGDAQVSMRGP